MLCMTTTASAPVFWFRIVEVDRSHSLSVTTRSTGAPQFFSATKKLVTHCWSLEMSHPLAMNAPGLLMSKLVYPDRSASAMINTRLPGCRACSSGPTRRTSASESFDSHTHSIPSKLDTLRGVAHAFTCSFDACESVSVIVRGAVGEI